MRTFIASLSDESLTPALPAAPARSAACPQRLRQVRNMLASLALTVRPSGMRVALKADTRETENLQFLAGQVHALIGFCIAIINTHPSPADLSLHVEAVEHVTLARVESALVIEDFLDGVRNVFDRLKTAVASAESRQAEQTATAEDISKKSDWEEAAAAQTAPDVCCPSSDRAIDFRTVAHHRLASLEVWCSACDARGAPIRRL